MSKICLCCGKPMKNESKFYWHSTCIKRFFGQPTIPDFNMNEIVYDEIAEASIEQGVSVPGVQKKLPITLPAFRRQYIIKTPALDKPFLPELEFIGMKLAEIAGFKTVPNGLIQSNAGEWVYITKRIDRAVSDGKIKKIAMEDFAQLSGRQTEYKYSGSYEQCAKKVIDRFSLNPFLDKILFFKMVFFSYVIGNTDMHLKNFSLMRGQDGYFLSPFYDILPVLMVVGQTEMALTVNGKNQKLTKNDFISFGENIGLTKTLVIDLINAILERLDDMYSFIEQSPITQDKKEELIKLIQSRSAPFVEVK